MSIKLKYDFYECHTNKDGEFFRFIHFEIALVSDLTQLHKNVDNIKLKNGDYLSKEIK